MDDVLQNIPSLKPTESHTPPVEATTAATSSEVVPHPQPTMSADASTSPQDGLGAKETSSAPVLGRSLRSEKPPQRLIEQI